MIGNIKGFTLLEILIVMIILGVLIGIAVPQFFRNIENSRSIEALENIGSIKRSIEACAMPSNNDFTACTNFTILSIPDPSYNVATNAGAHFSYTFTTSANTFSILAQRNTLDNGTATDTISLSRASNGAITRSGTSTFANIR